MHLDPNVLPRDQSKDLAIRRVNRARDAPEMRMQTSVSAAGDPPMPKLVWKALTLQQSIVHRAIALFDGAALCWNAKNGLSTLLMARGMIETVSFVSAFVSELETAIASRKLTNIDQVLMRHTFATKSERLSVAPEYRSKNVLTHIGRMDKMLFGNEESGFLSCYDALSLRWPIRIISA